MMKYEVCLILGVRNNRQELPLESLDGTDLALLS
jgi:hypothetical protein